MIFLPLFMLCTAVMGYHIGELSAKNTAVEQESFCRGKDDCYSVFKEESLIMLEVGQRVYYKVPKGTDCSGYGIIDGIEDDTVIVATIPSPRCASKIYLNFEDVVVQ